MKKIYIYKRGKMVEKGSKDDWEEEPLERLKKEYEKLTPEEKKESEKINNNYYVKEMWSEPPAGYGHQTLG